MENQEREIRNSDASRTIPSEREVDESKERRVDDVEEQSTPEKIPVTSAFVFKNVLKSVGLAVGTFIIVAMVFKFLPKPVNQDILNAQKDSLIIDSLVRLSKQPNQDHEIAVEIDSLADCLSKEVAGENGGKSGYGPMARDLREKIKSLSKKLKKSEPNN